jgi:hypothetical protein
MMITMTMTSILIVDMLTVMIIDVDHTNIYHSSEIRGNGAFDDDINKNNDNDVNVMTITSQRVNK